MTISHLNKHIEDLIAIAKEHEDFKQELYKNIGKNLLYLLLSRSSNTLIKERTDSFRTKNEKISKLVRQSNIRESVYTIPIINLSTLVLLSAEKDQLKLGLDYSFTDKNKYIKKNLAANFESISARVAGKIDNEEKEDFHEFLRAYTDIFTKNIFMTRDNTYSKLKRIIKDESIAVISGDKDSSVVIMNKADYVHMMQDMLE